MYFLKTPTVASRPDALVSLHVRAVPFVRALSACMRCKPIIVASCSSDPSNPTVLSHHHHLVCLHRVQVNLVHYEDAAAACVDALAVQLEGTASGGEIFLATDGAPVTRREMVESCLACAAYEEGGKPDFTVDDGPLGKSMNNPQTRAKLGWEPVYPSFTEFVAAGAGDSFYPKKKVNKWR